MSKRPRAASDLPDHLLSPAATPVDEQAQPPGKFTHLDLPAADSHLKPLISCSLPPHPDIGFTTYDDYEVHYQKSHVNRCIACGRNFPSDHYLCLHIAEHHDPLNAAKREKGEKTYHCFVEDCDKVCSTPQKRRMHLVDKHMFPRNYDFYVVNHGLDKRASLLRPSADAHRPKKGASHVESRSASTKHVTLAFSSDRIDVEGDQGEPRATRSPPAAVQDTSMEDVVQSMAALKFVPKSVTFGRGKHGGGLAKS